MKKLFYNGKIYTMAKPEKVNAILTNDKKIIATGDYDKLLALAPDCEKIDLRGFCVLPAFIDTHSHFTSYAISFLQVQLDNCKSLNEIVSQIQHFISDNNIKPGEWICAKGYDHNLLDEKCHPPISVADCAAPENPLVLEHISAHCGVFNSLAKQKLGISSDKDGYMEENDFISYIQKIPLPTTEQLLLAYKKAQEGYASYGITTIQDGMTVSHMMPLYKLLIDKGLLYLDLVSYISPDSVTDFVKEFPDSVGKYNKHLKLGGYKIFLDGSPQARTAWVREPYKNENPAYYGYRAMTDEAVLNAILSSKKDNMQILAHCNGDAAANQLLCALEKADISALRPVIIHAQLLSCDQLSRVARLKAIPSFFISHIYYWGDIHITNFGIERAEKISPAASALKHGITFTFHQDTPVIKPDMLHTVWCAVNRITKDGTVLGKDERISVYEAIKAITVNAAYQYFEEDSKGSLEVGKDADFVILDNDPFNIAPDKINSIRITGTAKGAVIIYNAK